MHNAQSLPLRGLIAAPFTPFAVDGSVDLSAIELLATDLIQQHVRGAFICGTTGEGVALSVAERMAVVERWQAVVTQSCSPFPLIVHVGALSVADAKDLARHAQGQGVAAVSIMPPCFVKPQTVGDIVAWVGAIAACCPRLPVTYYHIPVLSGVNVSVHELCEQLIATVPNFAGIKFTNERLDDYAQCQQLYGDRLAVSFGRDEMLLAALAFGAQSAVGSTYNFMAPLYAELWAAWDSGDLVTARRNQHTAQRIIGVLQRHGGIPAMKAIMHRRLGIQPIMRLPMQTLTDAAIDRLFTELQGQQLLNHVMPHTLPRSMPHALKGTTC